MEGSHPGVEVGVTGVGDLDHVGVPEKTSWPAATAHVAVSLVPLVPVEVDVQFTVTPPWPVMAHVGVPVGVAPDVEPGAAAEMVAFKVTASPVTTGSRSR